MLKRIYFWFKSFGSAWNDYKNLKDLNSNYHRIISIRKDANQFFDGKWKKCTFYFKAETNSDIIEVDEIKIDNAITKNRKLIIPDKHTKLLVHLDDSKFGNSSLKLESDPEIILGDN